MILVKDFSAGDFILRVGFKCYGLISAISSPEMTLIDTKLL